MWDDRFLFVIAALTPFAIILGPRVARLKQTVAVGGLSIKLHSIIVAAITFLLILAVSSQFWHHWAPPFLPNITSLIAILLGAIFGSFTARFVSTLFTPDLDGEIQSLALAFYYC